MVTPVTSEGSRSGVNWMREWLACTVAATARASEVLPVPGKSSSSRCPPDSRQVRVSRTTCDLPSTAADTFATSRSNVAANQAAWSGVTGACCPVVAAAVMNALHSQSLPEPRALLSPVRVLLVAHTTDTQFNCATTGWPEMRRDGSAVSDLLIPVGRTDL